MINDKYRVNEVAKDLNVQMKDIVDLLEKNFPGEKKRTTVLTNEELNFVFETYTAAAPAGQSGQLLRL